jgi:hypothetical protein
MRIETPWGASTINFRFRSKLVPFLLSVTFTGLDKYTLAYYGICKLEICNVFIVQAQGLSWFNTEMVPHLLVKNHLADHF